MRSTRTKSSQREEQWQEHILRVDYNRRLHKESRPVLAGGGEQAYCSHSLSVGVEQLVQLVVEQEQT